MTRIVRTFDKMGIDKLSLDEIYAVETAHPPLLGSRTSVVLSAGDRRGPSSSVSKTFQKTFRKSEGQGLKYLYAVVDNTGAKTACAMYQMVADNKTVRAGDIIKACIQKANPNSSIKSGEIVDAVIVLKNTDVRSGEKFLVKDSIVIVDNKMNPVGTRIFGPVSRELRKKKKFMKIVSLAPGVL